MFDILLTTFNKVDKLALAVGILIGLAVIALMRASQVWRHRQAFGYNAYYADSFRRRMRRVGSTALLLGVAGVGAWLFLWDGQTGGIFAQFDNDSSEMVLASEDALQDMKLLIPRLAVEQSVVYAPIVGQEWDISRLRYDIANLEGTVPPGQYGNAVLAAHVTVPGAGWGPFRELDTLQPGDEIFIQTGSSETYTYVVSERKLVDPGDIEVAYQTNDTRLTLITCSDWDEANELYAKRIVVIAHILPSSTGSISEIP